MKTHASGFTMIEMLVVLVILAVLAAIAAPNMGSMIRTQRVKTASFDVFAGLVLARSEALKRNTTVTVTPNGGDWASGWVVTDSNANTLRKQSGFTTVSITGPTTVVFTGSGRLSTAGSAPQFSITAPDVATDNQRCVKVDLSGRPVSSMGACT
jgi:type IV fimbrial biogenesis protein FimT